MYTRPQLSPLCLQVAHSILSTCYPGSFISSTLLVAVYIPRNYAGLELGFSDDCKEVQCLNTVFLTKGDTDYHQQKFAQLSSTWSRKSNRQIVNQLRQQCPSPQALHICWIHWQLGASSVLHKTNYSSCSRSFCLCEICPYLSTPNDTSPRIYAPFTIWEIYWEKVLYHKETGNFRGGNFLDQTIEWELMCLPLKIIWRNDMWLLHHWQSIGQKGCMPYPTWSNMGCFWGFFGALFHKGIPRKGNKCAPWTILKYNVVNLTEPLPEAHFVLEGGHLIHIVPMFSDDISQCVSCIQWRPFIARFIIANIL